MDGLLFYKKSIPYTSGPTDEVLWTKPYMLPDIFEGLALSQTLMDSKPDGYSTFEKFVEDVQAGRDPIKAPKKKKKKGKGQQEIIQPPKGAWFPQRPLNLPPPPPKQQEPARPVSGRGRPWRKVKQWSYYGPGTERPRVYGRGKVTGQNYYGDGQDVYYPPAYPFGGRGGGAAVRGGSAGVRGSSAGGGGRKFRGQGRGNQKQMQEGVGPTGSTGGGFGPVGSGSTSTGKQVSGGVLQQEMFGMGDMQAALAYLNYDQQSKRRPLHQKN